MNRPRVLFCLLLLLLAGCSKSHPPLARVIGKVSYQGARVTSGKVLFLPQGGGKQGIGTIQSDGTFELTTFRRGDGALVGEHHAVVLKATAESGREVGGFERSYQQWLAVEADSTNEFSIELDSGEWVPLPK
jgi:hypothetical protein